MPNLTWEMRKCLWDQLSFFKFRSNKAITLPLPQEKQRDIEPLAWQEKFPDINKICNIKVADHIPADEESAFALMLFDLQTGLYRTLYKPMQPGNLREISEDPEEALREAYTEEHRRYFPPPELPSEYYGDGAPDLGRLAVASPYAGYLEFKNDRYQWDLSRLENYEHHRGLYSLGVRVFFAVEAGRLEATEIECELGTIALGTPEWELAAKIALCAVSTHTSLIRHFNWIHLITGSYLAIATRNQLASDHWLKRLLWPHIFGTQCSNAIVTKGQMLPGGKFDTIFSFTHDGMCQLFDDAYNDYRIEVIDPEKDVKRRGLPEDLNSPFAQPVQQNLQELFNVIHSYVERYVDAYHVDDNDEALLAWLQQLDELMPDGIAALIDPKTPDRASLIRFIAAMIYAVTVQHEALGTGLWNYQLWVHKQPVRVYKDGKREPLDVYQRLVNANFDLNVRRTPLLSDLSRFALDQEGIDIGKRFNADLQALQNDMQTQEYALWKIYPVQLELNMNSNVINDELSQSELKNRFLGFIHGLNREFPWHQMPEPLGLLALSMVRDRLRRDNLHALEGSDPSSAPARCEAIPARDIKFRSYDGRNNDPGCPHMGKAGTRFGRNFAARHVVPDRSRLMYPDPIRVSRELLQRKNGAFESAKILNLLGVAWIQFHVHDWFAHELEPPEQHPYELSTADGAGMHIQRTREAPVSNGKAPAYINRNSHWWDGSQIYGNGQQALRCYSQGKLRLTDKALLPRDGNDEVMTGFSDNWWLGLELLHTLFVKEHNAICEALIKSPEYAGQSDEWLFQKARLINAALMAKIHSLEWTLAILPHETIKLALHANWQGLDAEPFVTDGLGRLLGNPKGISDATKKALPSLIATLQDSGLLNRIPGSLTDHHRVPYTLTEEFAAVYRMHPLIPDHFQLYSSDGRNGFVTEPQPIELLRMIDETDNLMQTRHVSDLFYSFGVGPAGALRLHNYPTGLCRLPTDDGRIIDLAAVDILRDRERGVPRYNTFRELLGMPRVGSFAELTDEPQWAKQIEKVYDGQIDQVDLMVGLFAEPLLPGFGFSETAFLIFGLMAPRRLESDRFFTTHYSAEVYTRTGLDWVENNTMSDVLLRHHPELESALENVENAFHPWVG